MEFDIHYGSGTMKLKTPEGCEIEVLEGKASTVKDEMAVIKKAISEPIDSTSLDEFLGDGSKVLVVTNDGTRPTPTSRMFDLIAEKIRNRPNTKILVGCGSHKPPSQDDYEFIFGKHYEALKGMINYNVSKDKDTLYLVGTTKRGNDIYMNKLVDWADKILITGSVEPHYFGGFTGGRKWVIGAAGFETLQRNHKLALSDSAAALALDGNPIHEELVEWDKLVNKPKWALMVVQDRELKATAAFSGNLDKVFEECVKVGLDNYTVATRGNADIVLTVSRPPSDNNLYQALKAQEHGKLAMKKGGILILVAQCDRGVGPSHFTAMLRGKTAQEVLDDIEQEFHLGHHKIAKLMQTFMKGKIYVVTCLPKEDMESLQMRRFETVQEAVDAAVDEFGGKARIIVMPDGGMTVPQISN